MERDFRSYQIQKYIKYIFLIKFLYEYFSSVNYSESREDFEDKDSLQNDAFPQYNSNQGGPFVGNVLNSMFSTSIIES